MKSSDSQLHDELRADSASTASSSSPNRLAREKSPYLLQHASNPVDWFPWGEEAFAKARDENKPIFLSIGYSTCHWCHVMERESFESAAIAAFLSEHFVSIKVDREERPDVDQVYMAFVQATTGHGGWPMSVWLTPQLQPFFGGTYFPPADLPGRPGFITVLRRIAELWKNDRDQIEAKAKSLLAALREAENEAAAGPGDQWNTGETLHLAVNQYSRMFDHQEGGFGGAPKFPRPVSLEFLLYVAAQKSASGEDSAAARGMALHTLRKMAAGGMHDHLGGGFHRYSVDAEWHVPHFEKMLYDQAQLVRVYLTAWQLSGEDLFAETARDILRYVSRDLTSPEGGFYSAEDADSLARPGAAHKTEGAFCVWTRDEIGDVLGPERRDEFCAVYGVEPDGNVSAASDPYGELEGFNVLIQRLALDGAAEHFQRSLEKMGKLLSADREALLARRALRPRPHLDDKILVAWNGLMIGAYARAAWILGDPAYLGAARRAAGFIRDHLFDSATGELLRSYRQGPSVISGFAADYAFLISGLLDLYQADFDLAWLRWARQLQDTLDLQFWDQERSGYFSTTGRSPAILLRVKEDHDGAEPAPTSVAALNLWRFGRIFHNSVMISHARHAIEAFASRLQAHPFGMPSLLLAAALLDAPPVYLILHSPTPDHPGLVALLAEARRHCLPQLVIIQIADAASREYFASRHDAIGNLPATPLEPAAYLCEDFTCRLPVTKPEELREMLLSLS
ncbi:MAG TPA: thioredoxin domain-containing protein [Candidatus Methylacidiphilales bacterium]|nr:thioredoxin domain-containing protein [Candidatus Methylacidiphilales bacterium]